LRSAFYTKNANLNEKDYEYAVEEMNSRCASTSSGATI